MLRAIAQVLQRRAVDYPAAETLLHQPSVDAEALRQEDGSLLVRWRAPADRVRVYRHDQQIAEVDGNTDLELDGVAALAWLQLVFEGGALDGQTLTVTERTLPLRGAVNVRDVGGYTTHDGRRTRWGRVYRAASLATLTETDLVLLAKLDVKLVCDLRTPDEAEEDPDRLPDSAQYRHVPVETDLSRAQQFWQLIRYRGRLEDVMLNAYTRVMIDGNMPVFKTMFELLADNANLPLMFHCTAGKDRTGVMAAVLLAFLGVPDNVIGADYSLSNAYYDTFSEIGAKSVRPLAVIGITEDTIQPLLVANPKRIQQTLDYIREHYGSVDDYLRRAGIDGETMVAVRNNLLS